jgi:hypothetical protein
MQSGIHMCPFTKPGACKTMQHPAVETAVQLAGHVLLNAGVHLLQRKAAASRHKGKQMPQCVSLEPCTVLSAQRSHVQVSRVQRTHASNLNSPPAEGRFW